MCVWGSNISLSPTSPLHPSPPIPSGPLLPTLPSPGSLEAEPQCGYVIRSLVHSGALWQQIGGTAQVCTVFTFLIQHRLSCGSMLWVAVPTSAMGQLSLLYECLAGYGKEQRIIGATENQGRITHWDKTKKNNNKKKKDARIQRVQKASKREREKTWCVAEELYISSGQHSCTDQTTDRRPLRKHQLQTHPPVRTHVTW